MVRRFVHTIQPRQLEITWPGLGASEFKVSLTGGPITPEQWSRLLEVLHVGRSMFVDEPVADVPAVVPPATPSAVD